MNRLQSVDFAFDCRQPASPSTPEADPPWLEPLPRHQFFIPLHYEKNYAYPLFIWLHGEGGNEQEINQVMPHISVRNYVGLSLRGGVEDGFTGGENPTGFTWSQSPGQITSAAHDVVRGIELAKERFHIAPKRVFLVGNAAGGTMALRLAMALPDRIAGVASLGGAFPETHTPLRDINQARSLPILISHCRDSDEYCVNHVCRDLRLLHAAGMSVTLRQYPCPQEVTTHMLADLNAWLMEHVCGQAEKHAIADDPTRQRLEELN